MGPGAETLLGGLGTYNLDAEGRSSGEEFGSMKTALLDRTTDLVDNLGRNN